MESCQDLSCAGFVNYESAPRALLRDQAEQLSIEKGGLIVSYRHQIKTRVGVYVLSRESSAAGLPYGESTYFKITL
jgi:hypothetical protein